MKLLASRQTGTTSYFKRVFKTFQENYRILLNMLSRSIKQFLQCKPTIKSVIYFTTELKEGLENLNESRWVLSRSPLRRSGKNPDILHMFEDILVFFPKLIALKKTSMSSNKDFLPSSSPIPSICATEIEAILFLFMMNCYKSSFQECITIIVLKIERTRNQPPYCLLQLQEKMVFHLPRSGCLGNPVTLPQSLY